MRIAIALTALSIAACRPLDAGAPIDDASAQGSDVAAAVRAGNYSVGALRVIDGDTFEIEGETVRIANIDAPEMPPRSECAAEAQLARLAKEELDDLLGTSWAGSGGTILPTLEREGQDRYRRTLARVRLVNGADAGEEMVRLGFAAPWTGSTVDWCGQAAPR